METLIDVCSVETFDGPLLQLLKGRRQLIEDYYVTDRRTLNEYFEHQAAGRYQPRASNPYCAAYLSLVESLIPAMNERTIRAWHYSRLTDAEVQRFQSRGIELSTVESLTARLRRVVEDGLLNGALAEQIIASSPLSRGQANSRENRFCMVSCPRHHTHNGVKPLLRYWGGEVAYFWQEDETVLQCLEYIGRGRILEIAVPLADSSFVYSASEAVVAAFVRSKGIHTDHRCFDIFFERALPKASILKVHTEGEKTFAAIQTCGSQEIK